ncbi:T9SS type A sorting domain-containing protein [Winogradskyella forsetii]|uniref:T9SS type A sorting domain-containing protein n=1 Tax=Winogradskyella forsetii TaxID=2686077 RepID=UPI0015BBCA32|nr:T9SS type A sorting domain-containing protein [Winogradskyella forsetii]
MKQFHVIVILVFCLQFGFGQIGFEENIIINNNINELHSTYIEDLDGDGDMDIISNNRNVIGWHENLDSSDNFTSLKVITTEVSNLSNDIYNSTSVHASDIDGDGDIDVLSASSGVNKIAWYENIDGQGTFGAQQIITLNVFGANSVYSEDLDNDGDMDVLSASWFDDKIAWYENIDGQGTFGPQQIISINADYANSVYAKDIDGDGDMDVLSASANDDKIAWYENIDGLGNFSSEQIIVSNFGWAYSVFSEDLDGDGDQDVLATSRYSGIKWFENLDGNGNFDAGQTLASSSFSFSVIAKDIDSDGDMDVLWSNDSGSNNVGWCENIDGQGTFSNQVLISNTTGVRNAFAADMDSDGYVDLVSASIDEDVIAWYKNIDGQGNFGVRILMPIIVDSPKSIYSTDIDGDGDMDVLSASFNDDKVAWFENVNGSFDGQKVISIDVDAAAAVYAEDLDGDGDVDVLSTSPGNNEIVWFENIDGQGFFSSKQLVSNAIDPLSVYADDLDNDGDMDVLSFSFNKIVWYENVNGLGDFGLQHEISEEVSGPSSVYAIDIDNDGDMDVLSASRFDDKIAWYENTNGMGVFGPQQVITSNSVNALCVYAIDIDNDGDMDVLSASSNDDKIAWYENIDGLGNFGAQQVITVGADSAASVYAEDIDNDGDFDVISASQLDDKIAWFENIDGEGTFGPQQIITSNADGTLSVYAIDIDNDGDIDILSASLNDNTIAWHENLGYLGNEINGTVNMDLNSDGCDNNDIALENLILSSDNGINAFSTVTRQYGNYYISTDTGDYITTIINLPSYFDSNPVSHSTSFIDIGNSDVANFCIEPIGVANDLTISVYSSFNNPRPGFNTTYQLVYNNIGTTQLSGSVSFEFNDSKINFLNASETISSQSANSLTFNFTDLNPFETRTIDLEFNVSAPPITNIDDILVATATVNPVSGDETEEDNVFTLEQTVIGSYDPNDIAVLEGEEITIEEADNYLHYLIRFQNTGTASAINVRVEHILDSKLDWTTMQLENLSHTGRVEITDETDVSFIFNNINLPDTTTDEPNSHGYIAFKIKPKSDVEVGDIISGTADIFFDFNPPITTNTVNTEIVAPLSIVEFNAQSIQLFPNPAKDQLKITSHKIMDKLTIVDINGRVLNDIQLSISEYTLDVSSLTKGVYFLEIQSGASKSTKKFIKN